MIAWESAIDKYNWGKDNETQMVKFIFHWIERYIISITVPYNSLFLNVFLFLILPDCNLWNILSCKALKILWVSKSSICIIFYFLEPFMNA